MIKTILKQTADGFLAGTMISIGCAVYLACENKYIGAILFSVALMTICYKGYSLYTGKIGYIVENHTKNDVSVLTLGLLGNVIATALFGIAIRYAIPSLGATAEVLVANKYMQEWWQTLIRAILCGILMYVAVSVYKEKKTIAGIVFCIPVFILSGFEHSIADMCYFAVGGEFSIKAFLFIMIVILGNSIGGVLFPLFGLLKKEKNDVQS